MTILKKRAKNFITNLQLSEGRGESYVGWEEPAFNFERQIFQVINVTLEGKEFWMKGESKTLTDDGSDLIKSPYDDTTGLLLLGNRHDYSTDFIIIRSKLEAIKYLKEEEPYAN